MNGREHLKGFLIMLIPILGLLIYLKMYIYIPLAVLSVAIFDPDEDQKFAGGKYHRSGLTHSFLWCIIINAAFYWFDLEMFMNGLFISTFPMIIHLFLDLFSHTDRYRLFGGNEKRVGKWRIHFFKRFNLWWSFVWIIANIIIMVIYDVLFILG